MTDIEKKIAELEDFMAKATPGDWDSWIGQIKDKSADGLPVGECESTYDAMLIVAMHNYLPDLIAEIKNASTYQKVLLDEIVAITKQRDDLKVRAENAEVDREVFARKLRTWLAEIEDCSKEQEAAKAGEEV